MKNKFNFLLVALIGSAGAYSKDLLFKEYSLKSGESIARLINNVGNLRQEDKIHLIEESLRVNRLSTKEATRLPIGFKALIPVSIYEFYKTSNTETVRLVKEAQIVEDKVSSKSAAITKVSTSILPNGESGNTNSIFVKIGLENTNIHTSDEVEDGDLQSVNIGIAVQINTNLNLGGSLIKDISENNDNYKSDDISYKLGLSYEFFNRGDIIFDINLGYESRNYNFIGLDINGLGLVKQNSNLIGLRTNYLINDTFSLSGGADYAISSSVKNDADQSLSLENSSHYQMEGSLNYHYQANNQLYFSVANEVNKWADGDKEVDYVSNLFKVGLIFKI